MTYLTAEFSQKESIAPAVSALAAAGVEQKDIEIFSEEPVELPRGVLDRRNRISLVAVLAALLGGGLATLFVRYTQHAYALVTGGMPLSSAWSTGVISYELTMAGAIAGTVLAFLWEGALVYRRKGGPVPALREGSIFVQVRCAATSAPRVAESLYQAGAVEVASQQEGP